MLGTRIAAIRKTLEDQARWRYEMSRVYKSDTRNHDAVKLFERMADEMSNGDFDKDQAARLANLVRNADADDMATISEILREVGFGFTPATVDELIGRLVSALEPTEPVAA